MSAVFTFNAKNEKRGIDFISQAIHEALKSLGAGAQGQGRVHKAATAIWNGHISLFLKQGAEVRSDSSLFKFADKAKQNMRWLAPFGVTPEQWEKTLIKQPVLFSLKPETVRSTFLGHREAMAVHGVGDGKLIKAFLKHPSLFTISSQKVQKTLETNIAWAKQFGVPASKWTKAAFDQPTLLYQNPETLRLNFARNVDWLRDFLPEKEAAAEKWFSAAISQPQLFYQSPDTLKSNFQENKKWLEAYGVSAERWAKAALKHPPLFNQKPKTLRKNFELMLAVLETPAFSNVGTLPTRESRVSWILSKPFRLSLAEDNMLLRLACAEVMTPVKTTALLDDSRTSVEAKLVHALGFDARRKRAFLVSHRAPANDEELKNQFRAYANELRSWNRKSDLQPFLPLLASQRDEDQNACILEAGVSGGLLKGYKLFRGIPMRHVLAQPGPHPVA
jgi:hypothetical protein